MSLLLLTQPETGRKKLTVGVPITKCDEDPTASVPPKGCTDSALDTPVELTKQLVKMQNWDTCHWNSLPY